MSDKNKGILYIILSALFFALMSTFVKLAGDLPSIQKSFFRNLIALIFSAVILIVSKEGFKFKKQNLFYLIARATFGTIGILCNFYAIDNLILADASMINKLAPFFVIIFSFIILKENIKLWQILSIFIAFLGSTFIINPEFILNLPKFILGNAEVKSNLTTLPALIGIIGAMFAGIAYTMIRKLTLNGERGSFIVFFFSAFSCAVTLPIAIAGYVPMSFVQVCYLLIAGIFASFGQFAITFAYKKAPAREISIFDYSQIIFSAIIGFFVFGQIPDKYSFLGYFIICSVALFMFFMGNRKEKLNNKII